MLNVSIAGSQGRKSLRIQQLAVFHDTFPHVFGVYVGKPEQCQALYSLVHKHLVARENDFAG
jgi:hypothetical protein